MECNGIPCPPSPIPRASHTHRLQRVNTQGLQPARYLGQGRAVAGRASKKSPMVKLGGGEEEQAAARTGCGCAPRHLLGTPYEFSLLLPCSGPDTQPVTDPHPITCLPVSSLHPHPTTTTRGHAPQFENQCPKTHPFSPCTHLCFTLHSEN